MDTTKNRTWLVFANREKCRHADSIRETNFINWVMKVKFSIGDIVYIFMSDERKVRFQMEVVEINCKREDQRYWVTDAPDDNTCKLKAIKEYYGDKLNERELEKHGFQGGRSIETPMYKNEVLFNYIRSIL